MQILSGSTDATVRHWNLTNGQAIRQMNHGGPVTDVAVRPYGQRFASSSANKTARLWNAANGAQIAQMTGDIMAKNRVAKVRGKTGIRDREHSREPQPLRDLD